MELSGKKLLILGGIRSAKEIIAQARRQGVSIIVTDYLEDSPAKKYADQSFLVSTTDVPGVVDLIRRKKIDGVITGFIDSLLPYYQEICEQSGLPCYGTREQFKITTNKAAFKNLCRAFDIPVVEDYAVPSDFTQDDIKALPYPILIKPTDYSGARGALICRNSKELTEKFPVSQKYSPSKTVLVEKYTNADELHIHYLVQDGEFTLAAMADRHMSKESLDILRLPVAYTYPSIHLDNYRQNLEPKVIDMLTSIGIQNGPLMIQAFVNNGKIIFYETGFRLNGTMEYKLIHKLNGINPMEMLINFALTGAMYDTRIKPLINPQHDEWGFSLSILARPGKIHSILGVEAVRSYPGVLDVVPLYLPGETIPQSALGTLSQIILRIYCHSKTRQDMAELMNKIYDSIRVIDTNGNDMLLDGFDTQALFQNQAY